MADQITPDMTPEQQLLARANKYKWVLLGIGAVLLAGSFAGLIISGVEAILALAGVGIAGAATVYFLPVVAMKAANVRMKMLVGEAEANPIETLKNDYIYRNKQLQAADDTIEEFITEIRNYDDQMRDFNKDYPDEADSFKEISVEMHAGLEEMKTEQANSRLVVEDLSKKIKKAEAIYKMSLAAQRVSSFSKISEQRVFADIKQQVAFDAVRSQLNRSFASLDRAMARRTELSSRMSALPGSGGVKGSLTAGSTDNTIPAEIVSSEKATVRRTAGGRS